ncbi:MAG TPA: IPT/TIG domain-containing protein [Candidatus Binatia bacterium]|nr:IPT/TIG domain-containing protein [Candidatus Binatia bacterium]
MLRPTLALVALLTFGLEAGASPIPLVVPQSAAFSVLGHSCGGIQEKAYATGFDVTSGYPTGDVYLSTSCGGSGRGGGYHTTTYSAWVGATWDFTGALVSYAVLSAAPTVDPTFSAFDQYGNEVYNQSNSAYLLLAPGFVPVPRVLGVSPTAGPASGGTTVTITGTGFTNATGVSFGGSAAASFVINADTSITAVSPNAGGGTVDITVTSAGGPSATSASDQFTFVATPTVSGVSPNGGPITGGTLVTITGANFVDVTAVYFGDMLSYGFTVNDDTSVTATSPAAEATDTVDVTVVTVGGTSAVTAADQFAYTTSSGGATCGNGVVDPGEQCDDGAANGLPGDCCTATCQFQPADTPCTDDGSLCTADLCDGAGTCIHLPAPAPTCTPPDVAGGASLLMHALAGGGNQTQFKWGKGPVVALADFGDPTGGEQLELCVYDQAAPGAYTLVFSGSPSVSGGGVWTQNAIGWKFKSTTGAPDGVTGVVLKAGAMPLQAKVQVKAMRSPSFGPLPLQAAPGVIAQLVSSQGSCWGATFSTPTVRTATEFKAKSD